MSSIEYDPVKDKFAKIIRNSHLLRRFFYALLDLFFLRSWHLRRLIKNYGNHFDKSGDWHVLDAGCGFGQYDRFILKQFRRVKVLSVDLKKDYLEDCRNYFSSEIEKGRICFRQEDLLSLDIEESFDMAICIDVLEHIEDDRRVIGNLFQVIKPGGYFIMHSPSHYSEEDADDDDSFVGEHARPGYSKNDIREKLEDTGFRIVDLHYTYGFWGHKAWLLSVKYPMIWFNRAGLAAFLILILYYPVVMPFCILLNYADLHSKNRKGNGIYAVGQKPG